MKKWILLLFCLSIGKILLADTQDYIKCDIVYKKPNVVYFSAGTEDGVTPGENFEIYYDQRIIATGRIAWSDRNISRSEEIDSSLFSLIYYSDDLSAKIRLYVAPSAKGGFLNIPYFSDLNLEPSSIDTPDDKMVSRLIHRGLLTRNGDGSIVPDLCGTFEVRDLTYTFYISPDARFHSGRPVESSDVLYSIQQLARSSRLTPASCFVLEIRGAEEYRHGNRNEIPGIFLIDKKTISITLRRSFPAFEDYLAGPAGYIIPRPGLAQPGGYVIGAGQYKIKWRNSRELALEPFEQSGKSAYLDSLIFLKFSSAEEAALSLELGNLDLVSILGEPPPRIFSNREITSSISQTNNCAILGVNSKRKFQKGSRFSKALSFQLDRETIIRVLLGSSARMPESPVPGFRDLDIDSDYSAFPDSADYYFNTIDKLPRAATLYIDSRFPALNKIAGYISGQLQNRGVKITEKKADLSTLDEERIMSDLDLYLTYYNPVSHDPDCLLYPLYSYRLAGQTNFLYYDDEAFQAFLEKFRPETDPGRRRSVSLGLSKALSIEPPAIILYQPHLTLISKSDIGGLKPTPEGYIDLRGAHIGSGK